MAQLKTINSSSKLTGVPAITHFCVMDSPNLLPQVFAGLRLSQDVNGKRQTTEVSSNIWKRETDMGNIEDCMMAPYTQELGGCSTGYFNEGLAKTEWSVTHPDRFQPLPEDSQDSFEDTDSFEDAPVACANTAECPLKADHKNEASARKQASGGVGSECATDGQFFDCDEVQSERQRIIMQDQENIRNGDAESCIIRGMKPTHERAKDLQEHLRLHPLTDEQAQVLKAVWAGKSVFVTGSAGTGKSYLLNVVIKILRKKFDPRSVFVTASTGQAAYVLGGTTLHSFAGVGLGRGSCKFLADKASANEDAIDRWETAKVLLIDEISMIDGALFDKLEYVARMVRGQRRPELQKKVFGGLQLIVSGDFFQLPPVCPENPQNFFAFQADCWEKCFDLQIELSHVLRQSDASLIEILNGIRKGVYSPEALEKLKRCQQDVVDDGSGILPTVMYPLKVNVSQENDSRLRALGTEVFSFLACDWSKDELHKHKLRRVKAEKMLHLSIGAQVMLITNLDTGAGLVNGARGVVVRFASHFDLLGKHFGTTNAASLISPSGKWPVVRFACDGRERIVGPQKYTVEDEETEVARRIQVPLILAWALSVHKCQGMTLDRVETDLSRAFTYGMVYVALSRVKSLEGLWLTGLDPSRIRAHPVVVEFYEKLGKAQEY